MASPKELRTLVRDAIDLRAAHADRYRTGFYLDDVLEDLLKVQPLGRWARQLYSVNNSVTQQHALKWLKQQVKTQASTKGRSGLRLFLCHTVDGQLARKWFIFHRATASQLRKVLTDRLGLMRSLGFRSDQLERIAELVEAKGPNARVSDVWDEVLAIVQPGAKQAS